MQCGLLGTGHLDAPVQQLGQRVEVGFLAVHLCQDLIREGVAHEVGSDAVAHGLHPQSGNATAHGLLLQLLLLFVLVGNIYEQHDDDDRSDEQGQRPLVGQVFLLYLLLFLKQRALMVVAHHHGRYLHAGLFAHQRVAQVLLPLHSLGIAVPVARLLVELHQHLLSDEYLFGNHPCRRCALFVYLPCLGGVAFEQCQFHALRG